MSEEKKITTTEMTEELLEIIGFGARNGSSLCVTSYKCIEPTGIEITVDRDWFAAKCSEEELEDKVNNKNDRFHIHVTLPGNHTNDNIFIGETMDSAQYERIKQEKDRLFDFWNGHYAVKMRGPSIHIYRLYRGWAIPFKSFDVFDGGMILELLHKIMYKVEQQNHTSQHKHMIPPSMTEPVGFWVACCTPERDLIKWGIDGDTVYPHKTREEAEAMARRLMDSELHKDDAFYILNVFANGQMRTDEIDR